MNSPTAKTMRPIRRLQQGRLSLALHTLRGGDGLALLLLHGLGERSPDALAILGTDVDNRRSKLVAPRVRQQVQALRRTGVPNISSSSEYGPRGKMEPIRITSISFIVFQAVIFVFLVRRPD